MLWPVAKAFHQGADTLLILKPPKENKAGKKQHKFVNFFLHL